MGDVKRYEEVPDCPQLVLPHIHAALLTRHNALAIEHAALLINNNALVEAVAWERECGTVSFTDLWFDEWNRNENQSQSAMQELRFTRRAARAEVDRLIGGE